NKLKSGPAVFLRVNCVGKINAQFTGEFAPKLLNNGLTIGAVPAEVEFDAGSGELENEPNGPLKYTGKFKTQGFGAQELIEVQNPEGAPPPRRRISNAPRRRTHPDARRRGASASASRRIYERWLVLGVLVVRGVVPEVAPARLPHAVPNAP